MSHSIEVASHKHRANVTISLHADGETSDSLTPDECRRLARALRECADNAEQNGSGLIIDVELS